MLKKLLNNRMILNGGCFSIFSIINQGFSFLILIVLASFISPSEYGYLSLFATVTMVVGYFMAMSTEGYLSVSFFKNGDIGIRKTVSCILPTTLGVMCLMILLLCIDGERISTLLDLPIHILFAAIGVGFFTVYCKLSLDYFRIYERVAIYGILSCSFALINFVLSILLVKNFSMGWTGRVYTQLFCSFLFGSLGICLFFYRNQIGRPEFPFWKSMLIWGIPLIPHLATTFIKQGMDRYIINSFYSISDVGLFSFAMNLANIIIMLGDGFNQANSVEIYKVLGDENLSSQEKERRLICQRNVLIRVFAVITVMVLIFVPVLLPLVMPNYVESIKFFIILSVCAFIQCIYLIYTNFLFFFGKTKIIMLITFTSAIFHLCLSFLLTRYSLVLTCLIYIISQSIVTILIRRFAIRSLKQAGICHFR